MNSRQSIARLTQIALEGCLQASSRCNAYVAQSTHQALLSRPGRLDPRRQLLTSLTTSLGSSPSYVTSDPFSTIKSELNCVSERMRHGVSSEIPALQHAAGYLFEIGVEGKRIRPSICLLLSSALSADRPATRDTTSVDLRPVSVCPEEVRRRQQRIAEIAELIHVASLLHDDVIDEAETRRGKRALNLVVGNKVAILAGDFLLARASMTLASLENTTVVQLMSQILEDLVSGEILQATAAPESLISMEHYMRKTYHKTASLMANACKATAVITGSDGQTCDAAFNFGRNLGLAFQVVDDVLDYTSSSMVLGKPALNDIKAGLVTCPVLFAAEEHPELAPMIQRKFRNPGDIDHTIWCVQNSQGIQRSRHLAESYIQEALESLDHMRLPKAEHADIACQALRDLCLKVLHRKK